MKGRSGGEQKRTQKFLPALEQQLKAHPSHWLLTLFPLPSPWTHYRHPEASPGEVSVRPRQSDLRR